MPSATELFGRGLCEAIAAPICACVCACVRCAWQIVDDCGADSSTTTVTDSIQVGMVDFGTLSVEVSPQQPLLGAAWGYSSEGCVG